MSQDIETIKQKTFYGGIWKLMERVLAQSITFVVSLVLARILSPNEYGVIAIVTIMINLMNVFVTSGYGAALIQKKDADDKDFNTIFTFSGSLSVVLYLVLFFLAPYIAAWYKNETLTLLIRVMGLRLPIASFNSIQQAYVAKKMEYRKFFWATLGGTIASGMVGVVMALLGCGIWSLVGQYFMNTLVDSVVLYCIFPWRYKIYYSRKRANPMIKFGSGVLLASLIDAIYQELRAIVVGVKYKADVLAYYNRGEQFPKLISLNMATAIDGTLLPAFSLLQDDQEKIRQGLLRSVQISTLIVAPLMLGMAAVARPMVFVLLTAKWQEAIPYVSLFCVMYALNPLISATNQVIKAMGSSGLFFKIELIKKTGFVILLVAAMPFGPVLIAASSVVAMVISCGINAIAVKKVLALPILMQLKACIPQFFAATVMALVILPMEYMINNMFLLLVAQMLAGVLIYLAIMFVSKNKAFYYMLQLLKNVIGRQNKCKT